MFTPTQLNLAIGTPPNTAEKDLSTVGSGDLDTVVSATAPGTGGNSITVALTGDSPAGRGVSITCTNKAVTIHYESGVSTVAQVEAAIEALAGAGDLIRVKTPGSGTTVLTAPADNFAATALTGGAAGRTIVAFMLGDNRLMAVGPKGSFEWEQDDVNSIMTFTPKNMSASNGLPASAPGMIYVITYEDIKHVNYVNTP